jgi:Glycosyl transferase family 11
MRKIYLVLTGGLGNQLFQVSAALAASKGDQIFIEWTNSKPRLSSSGLPEIWNFQLPDNVSLMHKSKFQRLPSKSIGYVLRMGVNPKSYELKTGIQKFITTLASIISIPRFGKYLPIHLNQGVGFWPGLETDISRSCLLVGYFQTYKWQEVTDEAFSLNLIKVKNPSPELEELRIKAQNEDPLIVHMRFGDYKLEDTFGILSRQYYVESILEMYESKIYKSIWVFSDEIGTAKDYLSGLRIGNIRYFADISESATQTLEAMRLGKGYVIGNSSFSWWAARLSYFPSAVVIAPKPWFLRQTEPKDLIPLEWLRRQGH